MAHKKTQSCCPPKPELSERPLLSGREARELAVFFKVLSSDTRLRLLHALAREGEMFVTELAETVGMTPQAVSNQLQRLLDRGIVVSEREGNNMRYRVDDPCVIALLDKGLCLMEDAQKLALDPV
jgi:DNA-binding transcriptional ArsR family regulator